MRRCSLLLAAVLLIAGLPQPTAAQAPAAVEGTWLATLRMPDLGEIVLRMDARQAADGRFTLQTRRGAARELLGWPRALLGRMAGAVPAGGSLATLRAAHVDAADGAVRGTFASPATGTLHFRGERTGGGGPRIHGNLYRDTLSRPVGSLDAVPGGSGAPVRDYPAIARGIETAFAGYLFDPALMQQPRWRQFFRTVHRNFGRANDDLEALAGFFLPSSGLGMSHVQLFRNPALAGVDADSILVVMGADGDRVSLSFPAPGVALMSISQFSNIRPAVAQALSRVESAGAHTLLVDIRGNSGGDVSSMAVLSHLIRDSVDAGVFIGRGWYGAHGRAPADAEKTAAHTISGMETTASDLVDAVRQHGLVRGIVPPSAPHFPGDVFILTNSATASAGEPLTYLVQSLGRGLVAGGRTAGAMLSAPPHSLGEGWILRLPEADYLAGDGVRLEGRGVLPDLAAPSSQAVLAVARHMAAQPAGRMGVDRSVDAARLEGFALSQLRRWAEATHAYARALGAEPWHVPTLLEAGLAYEGARSWDHAFAAYDRILAIEPESPAATYRLGRIAAISGQQLDRGAQALRRYLAVPPAPGMPAHAAAHWRLGQVMQQLGDLTAARREFAAAVELEPDNLEYRQALRSVR